LFVVLVCFISVMPKAKQLKSKPSAKFSNPSKKAVSLTINGFFFAF